MLKLLKKVNQNGFSVIEIMTAVGILSFLALAMSSIATLAVSSETKVSGIQNAIEQRSEIKSSLLKVPQFAGSGACITRLGLTGGETFASNTNLELPNIVHNDSRYVNLDRAYLTQSSFVGPSGANNVYSAQLVLEQSLQLGASQESLRPHVLGLMNLIVDQNGAIVGCNWDEDNSNVLEFCNSNPGLQVSGTNCHPKPIETLMANCPGGTAMDLVANHCVPADVQCYEAALAYDFDGSSFDCSYLSPEFGIVYPSGYVPRPSPTPPNAGVGSTLTPPRAQPTPPTTCKCGDQTMDPGGDKLCVRAEKESEGFGNYDDMFYVKVCNSRGVLEDANPAHYFEEEGIGTKWNWRIGTCQAYGGTKNTGGIHYKRGKCF